VLTPLANSIERLIDIASELRQGGPEPKYVFNCWHSTLLRWNTIPVKRWKNGPVTGNFIQLPLAGMPKRPRHGPLGTPGRKPDSVPPARSAFSIEFAARVKAAREATGLTQDEMAQRLSKAVGYEILPDSYRKYEGGSKPSFMPLDLLFHFAEITGKTVGTLVAPIPFPKQPAHGERPPHGRHSRTGTY
jgi:hypothetical protein